MCACLFLRFFFNPAILQPDSAWKQLLHAPGVFFPKKRYNLITVIKMVTRRMIYVMISCVMIFQLID